MSRSSKQLQRNATARAQAIVEPNADDNTAFFVVAIVVCVGFVMANEVTTRYAIIKECLYALTAIGALVCLSLPKQEG